jgi:hypothetical protein
MIHHPSQYGGQRRVGHMDIAHFRAPYKNSMLGFGAEPTAQSSIAALTDQDPSTFVLSFKPTVASGIMSMIGGSVVIMQGGDDTVSIVPALSGDPRETVAAWIKRKLAEGKEVAAGSSQGIPGVVMPLPPEAGLQKFLQAGNAAAIIQVTSPQAGAGGAAPLFAVLARPGSAPPLVNTAGMGASGGKTLAVVAIAGAVGVGLYYIFRKPSRGAS